MCALGFGVNLPVLIIPVGIIYLCEILSVVIQVTYFKLTHGKRIFKMTPIHHHFEMCGWSEVKICCVVQRCDGWCSALCPCLVYCMDSDA